jgi:hypothetical protein
VLSEDLSAAQLAVVDETACHARFPLVEGESDNSQEWAIRVLLTLVDECIVPGAKVEDLVDNYLQGP